MGTHTPGMTVTWFRHTAEGLFNAEVGMGLDAPAFWDLFVDALKRID